MVSAIVLSYNRCDEVVYTLHQLVALQQRLPFPLEIIVVDNASTDHTAITIDTLFPDILLVDIQVNKGIAGWNEGFKIAAYPFLLVLDDDSHLETGLEEAVAFLTEHDDVGILALNIISGAYATKEWTNLSQTIGFIGCGAIIKKEVYYKIGGFAEWIGVNSHEWEYGIRCIDAGYKIVYFEKTNVIHRAKEEKVLRKNSRVSATKNEMAIVYKHFCNHRLLNIMRVWLNSMKLIKQIGIKAIYFSFLGAFGFLRIKSKLAYTPVSAHTQSFFEHIFWGTQPVFKIKSKTINNKNSE